MLSPPLVSGGLAPTADVLPRPRKSRARQYRHKCPECGEVFMGPRDAVFDSPDHKNAFHNRMKRRGQSAIPLLLAARAGRGRKGNETATYANRELSALADLWNAEDRAAGRMAAADYIKPKMRSGWKAVDILG